MNRLQPATTDTAISATGVSNYWPHLRTLMTVIVFVAAFWLLHHEFSTMNFRDVADSFRSIPLSSLLLAVALTIANYGVMIGYDAIAVRLVGHRVTAGQIATTSLLSYAVTNSLGTLLGGTPVRFRLYSAWGLSTTEVIRLIYYISIAFWIGLVTLGGILFVAAPFEIPARLGLPLATSRPLGFLMLTISAVFLLSCALRRHPVHLLGINLQPPPLRFGLAQVAVSAVDFLLASATLYVLLPPNADIGFLSFVAIFILAIVVAMLSHVPGGVGVLELVLVTILPKSSNSLIASLLAFRIIYYLLPLLTAIISVGVATLLRHQDRASEIAAIGLRWTRIVAPRIMTGAVFVCGMVLLISGSLPVAAGRLPLIRSMLPLSVVEVSHFIGSVAGAMLLVLSRGLYRRIDAAWGLTVVLLAVGVVVSLAKGFDYEEATILLLVLLALIPCRQHYFRRGRLLAASFDFNWILAVTLSLGMLIWLILFSFRHVDYNDQLWWSFAYHGDAPRALRGFVGAAVVLAVVGVTQLLHPAPAAPGLPSEDEIREADAIVKSQGATYGNLALLGDKRFIFSEDRRAFVMFGCEGRSWIAMGDPVGPDDAADDAAWKFREACDVAGVWPVFYQVAERSLSRYIDMGLSMLKLGEEARVRLADFSLDSRASRDLRRTNKKALEEGLRFEIVPPSRIDEIMPRLKEISDAWLGEKSTAEKGFSLGTFRESYLRRCDIALIIRNDQPIAFANLWQGTEKHELSIDLMRYSPAAPRSVMEYMFIQLMLWGREQGYEWFNLGMAPLSGIEAHRLASLWNRASSLIFRHGEHFYNFQGLRNYKSKFNPEWTPKYLASPGGLASAQILANVSILISGGVRRLFRR
ncbi:MAG: bifunctional lysylphosphatidylglycerol flippase/synthetase MprF [Planctomycetaceae bacterium]|nr:bifunctional lysylphosphatidylglycerol flippase/synthetase MprF [Planctomycetaceae bacterium]